MKFTTSYKLLSDPEKAVVSLMAIDKEVAAAVMSNFSDTELIRIVNIMKNLGAVDYPVVIDVMEELDLILGSPGIIVGNDETVQKVISNFLAPEKVKRIMQKIGTQDVEPGIWNEINTTPNSDIVAFLKDVHPQTSALILTKLNPAKVAQILDLLPKEVACRSVFSILETISPPQAVMVDIEETIYEEFLSNRSQGFDSIKLIAEVLQDLDKVRSGEIQKYIEDISPKLAAAIRALMFSFDDIVKIEPDSARIIIEKSDRDKLLVALKGAEASVRERFFGFLPGMARGLMENDMDLLGPLTQNKVRESQNEIVQLLMKLEREGQIQINRY